MIRRRPSHATIVSLLALAVAISTGSAWAVATIGPDDIEDNAVLSRHILDGQVHAADVIRNSPAGLTGADFADNSLTGADVDETSLFNVDPLTGADINESALGTVPSAANADSATNASLLQLHPSLDFATDRGSFRTSLARTSTIENPGQTPSGFNIGQLTLRVECNSGPDVNLQAGTRVDNAMVRAGSVRLGVASTNYVEDDDFDVGELLDLVPSAAGVPDDDSVQGTLEYFNPARSESVTATFLLEETSTKCIFAAMPSSTFFSP
jgi:hypothetical protein